MGFTNSIGMRFVLVEPGKFLMGSPADEEGRFDNEHQHEVTDAGHGVDCEETGAGVPGRDNRRGTSSSCAVSTVTCCRAHQSATSGAFP